LNLYFDSAYIAKCYLNEPDGRKVRELARAASGLYCSSVCLAELACIFHRHVREASIDVQTAAALRKLFRDDVENRVWSLIPVSDRLLHRVELLVKSLPAHCFVRAGDAIHLTTAIDAGFTEIWTTDRHMLQTAGYTGLTGRSVA
jgi:predicted nucleic acid-binding protein